MIVFGFALLAAGGSGSAPAEAGFSDFPTGHLDTVAGPAASGAPRRLSASKASSAASPGHHLASGKATWYGPGFHGRRTASGERFDAGAMTAAHRSLPFGSLVRVTSEASGRSVVVRINDRGPARGSGAMIDLSRASAQALGMSGTAQVRLARLSD